jgi:hypothetical protein
MIQDIRTINKKNSNWNVIQIKENGVWREMEHVVEDRREKKIIKKTFFKKALNLINKVLKKAAYLSMEMMLFIILFVGTTLLAKFICTLF